ncbi:methyltransferase domain-containing protein [bacterium]|nr:methyltransferase domain-containing protein [bacterium]MBU1985015.1 methyltransferase domain-containing protein [bacterium]
MSWIFFVMEFANVYQDAQRAGAYDTLEFPGTYYLAFRDIPAIILAHVTGKRALDFGCGTGRSTRFLKRLGFDAVGVDIAEEMLERARLKDPVGEYRCVDEDGLSALGDSAFDLILSAFTFDNIPTSEKKVRLLDGLRNLLKPEGRIVNLVSSPDIYTHEWASFTTRDFPENQSARSGDVVRIVMTDVDDRRPVEDVIWFDDAYRENYAAAGLELLQTCRPLADANEPYTWVSETRVAPWVIYVLSGARR